MVKKQSSMILNFVAWFTGVVVSLAVGFGMVSGTLGLPEWLGGATYAGEIVVQTVGWIVIVTTLISVVLAILQK